MSTAPNRRSLRHRPTSPLDGVTRRSTLKWMTLAWTGFAAATAAGLTATVRFLFPNVLFEPPTRFKAGDPSTYALGRGRALEGEVRGLDRPGHRLDLRPRGRLHAPRLHAELAGRRRTSSSARATARATTCPGINFEGPAPRPLERAEIGVSAEDGQIIVDKATRYLYERGQWSDPKAFVKMA